MVRKMKEMIDVKTGYQCNNHCKFCVQGDKRDFCRDKTSSEIKDILKNSKGNDVKVIFTGGECTIRPDIIELVAYSKSMGYKIHIQTNGRMFAYKDFCRKMVQAGAFEFTIALHGHKAELHDYLTGAKGSFEQVFKGIRNLVSLGCHVFTNVVITRQNYCFLPEIASLFVDLGAREYKLTFPHILGSALKNRKLVVPRKKIIAPYVKKALEIGLKRKCRPLTEAIPYCLLEPYIDCASEKRESKIKVFDTETIDDFNFWRKEEGKCKAAPCVKCRYFHCCEGPWREYPRFYGWNEFKPVL
jgi:MoaA/NifB/PqqE/SkfB family radical SAM enzyme